jgi:hypothetical protein
MIRGGTAGKDHPVEEMSGSRRGDAAHRPCREINFQQVL